MIAGGNTKVAGIIILVEDDSSFMILFYCVFIINIREIAQVRMSFRDIGAILDKARKEKETSKSKHKRCPNQHKHTNSFPTARLQ